MARESLVLDASVVVKWFTQEENRKEALKMREMFINGEVEIICPDLILYELSNALRFNPNFSAEDVQNVIDSIINLEIDITFPISSTLDKAIELSFSKNITLYDSFYAALAMELNCKFVTADEKLCNKIKDVCNVVMLSAY